MEKSVAKTSLRLTKSDVEQLELLTKHFGECKSSVIKRALILLHYITFKEKKK